MSLDLDAIAKRAAEATPGPWNHNPDCAWQPAGGDRLHEYVWADTSGGTWVIAMTGYKGEHPQTPADAEFIAASRTDVPALVQRIRELEAAVATVEIPCRMHHGTSHPLTLREAAVVIVTMFGMAEDDATHPSPYAADRAQCVREILSLGKDQEGYAEHVESLLGPDAFDYPDVS